MSDSTHMPTSTVVWLLFDLANGHPGSHRYCWWFATRREARAHRRHQHRHLANARLSQPVRAVVGLAAQEVRR